MSWIPVALSALLALAMAGFVGEKIAEARDRGRHPPPGALVDIGGLRLHATSSLTAPQAPTVVLEGGHGMWSLSWGPVFGRIAELAPVLAYDRAGYGWSEPSPAAHTPFQVVSELHALLERTHVPPPYVLVGHSLGGLYVRLFANRYPEEVVGLVLIDSLHEKLFEYVPSYETMQRSSERASGALAAFARVGLPRLLASQRMARTGYILPADRAAYAATFVSPRYLDALRDETVEIGRFIRSRPSLGDLGNRPVAVIQAHHPEALPPGRSAYTPESYQEFLRGWSALQQSLLGLSTRSRFYQSDAGHGEVMSEDPGTVIDAVQWVQHAADPLPGDPWG